MLEADNKEHIGLFRINMNHAAVAYWIYFGREEM